MDHFILMSAIRHPGSVKPEEIEEQLKNVITVINKIHKKDFITSLDLLPPNEFQGITNSLQATLEIIFYIEAKVLKHGSGKKVEDVE